MQDFKARSVMAFRGVEVPLLLDSLYPTPNPDCMNTGNVILVYEYV